MSDIAFEGVSRTFRRDGRDYLAVDNVSFQVREREFLRRHVPGLKHDVRGVVKGPIAVEQPANEKSVGSSECFALRSRSHRRRICRLNQQHLVECTDG